jgi:hypothetical protein
MAHSCLKFSYESNLNKLPFLDILIERVGNLFNTILREPTLDTA